MKRMGSVILVLAFLISIMQIAVSAQDGYPAPACDECEVEVFIPEDLSPEVRAKILANMFGETDSEPEQDRNIICTLFGHDYEITYSYSTSHNVYTTSPKCVRNTYKNSTCTRCGHTETELYKSERISTCHG